MAQEKEKLELLKNRLVFQIVMDALHKRREKYSTADNSGQHNDYKDIIKEVKNDYEKQLKLKT